MVGLENDLPRLSGVANDHGDSEDLEIALEGGLRPD